MGRTTSNSKNIKSQPWLLLAVVLVGLLVAFVVLVGYDGVKPAQEKNPYSQLTSTQVSLADEITDEIGLCPCGQCNVQLTACDCDHPKGAETLKGTIAQGIKQGWAKDQILQDLQQRYGISVASPVVPSQ